MKKVLSVLMITFILFAFNACSKSTIPIDKEEEPKETKTVKVKTFVNLDGEFVPLKSAVINSSFKKEELENSLNVFNGEGVLYSDKKSIITVEEIDGMNVKITVDDSDLTLYCEGLEMVSIADLNVDDNFNELVLYSSGPSADPTIDFLHYDGENIIPIEYHNEKNGYVSSGMYGDLDADNDDVYPTYGALWTDKKGRIITSFDNVAFTHDRIALSYYILENNIWRKHEVDFVKLPYNSVICKDFSAFFTPLDEKPDYYENYSYINDFDKQKEFKKGQSVQILEYGKMYNYYAFYVNIDGEKGVLAYFLGD